MTIRRKILIVDDDQDGATSLGLLLELEGHSVVVRFDGHSTMAALETERPDVAFLDLTMPDLSGYELCRRLRALHWGEEPFVFALTGWTRVEDEALAAGFDGCLVKPCSIDVLRRLLADPKSRSRRIDRARRGPLRIERGRLDDVDVEQA